MVKSIRNAATKIRVGWKLPVSQAFMKEIKAKKNRCSFAEVVRSDAPLRGKRMTRAESELAEEDRPKNVMER